MARILISLLLVPLYVTLLVAQPLGNSHSDLEWVTSSSEETLIEITNLSTNREKLHVKFKPWRHVSGNQVITNDDHGAQPNHKSDRDGVHQSFW